MGKIILAGGSGFIGGNLISRFSKTEKNIVVLTRNEKKVADCRTVHWDGKNPGPWTSELEESEMVINLAGRSVDCRYNEGNKREILSSRVDATNAIGKAIQQLKSPPKLWINSSTATIYRHAEDRPMDEGTGEIGSGFSVDVAKKWEESFWAADTPATRKVALRTAIVLGKNGGVLTPFRNLVKFGLGGQQGDGQQMFSWIHEEDLFEIIQYVRVKDITGVLNCSAPYPIKDYEFMKALRKKMGMPFGIPLPGFLLTLGAFFLRTETELILKSRWVIPGKLLQDGYKFKYPTIQLALEGLF